MQVFRDKQDPSAARLLLDGGIGILKTDTLYGVVAKADDEVAVDRVYELKSRDQAKSPIVLISSIDQLFDIVSDTHKALLGEMWPGPVSIIVPSKEAPLWLRRSNDSVAYRLPADESLIRLIEQTGPLVAPSANPEGEHPAMDINQARDYFGDRVDFYIDEGPVTNDQPSQIIKLLPDGTTERLR